MSKPASPALQSGNSLATGLQRCFVINEGSGSTLHDYSGNADNLTTRTSGSTANATWGSDVTQGAYVTFDGSTKDAVGSDTGLPTGTTDRALALLVRTTGNVGTTMAYGNGGNGTIGIGMTNFGVPNPGTLQVTTVNNALASSGTINDNAWHLCVATLSGGTWTFYIDGVAKGTGTVTAMSTALGGTAAFFLGQIGGGLSYFPGDVAGAWVWSRNLTPTDVSNFQSDPWQMVRSTQSFTLSPNTAVCGTPATVTATGTGTAWTTGTTFSVSGGTGASISGTSVNQSTQVATFTLNPGSAAGTLTISDSTDAATATVTVSPAAPTGVSATGGNAQVVLNWTLGSGDATVNVYRGTTPGGESGTPIASGVAGTTYTDTGLVNGTTYYYKLKGSGNSILSAFSAEVSATPSSGPSVSPSVANLGAGYTLTLTASGFSPAPTFTSSNTAVATVGASSGIVTGVAAGTATVTVTDGTHTLTASVTVSAARAYLSVAPNFTSGLSVTVTLKTAAGASYPWFPALSWVDLGNGSYSVYGVLPSATDLVVTATDGSNVAVDAWNTGPRPADAVLWGGTAVASLANYSQFLPIGTVTGTATTTAVTVDFAPQTPTNLADMAGQTLQVVLSDGTQVSASVKTASAVAGHSTQVAFTFSTGQALAVAPASGNAAVLRAVP